MPKDKDKSSEGYNTELIVNNNLPTLFIDGIYVNRREDDMNLIRLSSSFPDGVHEQVRFMAMNEDVKSFIKLLCEIADYYPLKPRVKRQKQKT